MILQCTCVHAYQDATYGRGLRVYNPRYEANSAKLKGYRCSVCSHTIDRRDDTPAKKSKKETT